MKEHIENSLLNALRALQDNTILPAELELQIKLDRSRDIKHGDYASNCALVYAKAAKLPPRELAQHIIEQLSNDEHIANVSIAGPGFINFKLADQLSLQVIAAILEQGQQFGCNQAGKQQKIHMEYVSSNPTGPLHVGHGRQAAYGDSVANLLDANGYQVHREYYVNDAGRQMAILAISVLLRYLEHQGQQFTFPSNGYQGDYLVDIAKQLDERYQLKASDLFQDVPADAPSGDKEAHIDGLIENAKKLLTEDTFIELLKLSLQEILADIRDDLAEFNVTYDEWFSERRLLDSGAIERGIQALTEKKVTYEKEGALWFAATQFGDEKDRVLVRANGQTTYFASDVAYHLLKLERGNDFIVDILGADHHGYVPRVRAVIEALRGDPERLEVSLVQFVSLFRGSEKVQMSTRSGSFITLRQLRAEVGNDAARFFYIMRKNEQHLDFDLALATSQTNDNPVYYIQYAHARICSVFRQCQEKNIKHDQPHGLANLTLLTQVQEIELIRNLSRYSETIRHAGQNYGPHVLANYLRELANDFHTYYNAYQFIVDQNDALRDARLCLIKATQQVLTNGLSILGISAPEEM